MKRFACSLFLLALSLSGLVPASAQVPGGIDPSFQPPVTDQPASQVLFQSTGQAIIAGNFSTVNGTATGPVARLSTTGALDQSFTNASADYLPAGDTANSVRIALQADDKILLFIESEPTGTVSFIRLNANGTRDTSFFTTLNGVLSAFVVQSDGHIVITGSYTMLNGVPAGSSGLAPISRLNPDGSTESAATFNDPGLAYTFIDTLTLQEGRILLTGVLFVNADGYLTRLNTDGSQDSTFNSVDLSGGTFTAVTVQANDQILVSYTSSTFNGKPYAYAARLYANGLDGPNGNVEPSFNPGTALNAGANTIIPQADGKIVFATNGVNNNAPLVRLNADYSVDRDFAQSFLFGSSAFGAARQADGNIVMVGTVYLPNGNLAGAARVLGGNGVANAATVSVLVPGLANPWLAAAGATDSSGDTVPAEAPVRVTGLALTAGTTLSFTASGAVFFAPTTSPMDGPDGEATFPQPHAAENGLSGITAPVDSLLGVFIDDTVADPTNANAPAALDFTTAGANPSTVDFATLAPALGQMFFIGDGSNAANAFQQFTVPAGATHLVLGTLDGSGWYNNSGGFRVTVSTGGTGGGGSNTLTPTTFTVNGSNVPSAITAGAAITFTATQGAAVTSGVYVRVQAAPVPAGGDITTIPENTWTDLTDPANGGNGFLKGDGNGNYTLTTTQYPTGVVIAFRAISAAPGQTDSISNVVGPFDFTTTTPPAAGPLVITETASTTDDPTAAVALAGDQIKYTFSVVNKGPDILYNVTVTDVLPANLQFQVADNPGVLTGGNTVTWTFPQLSPNPGSPITLSLVASVNANVPVGTVIVNSRFSVAADGVATVQGSVPDGTTIIPPLLVTVVGGRSPVTPGETITYTLNVTNRTQGKIKGIDVSIPLPGPTHLLDSSFVDANGAKLSSSGGNPSFNGGNLVFHIAKLKPGKSMYLQFTVVVPLDADPPPTSYRWARRSRPRRPWAGSKASRCPARPRRSPARDRHSCHGSASPRFPSAGSACWSFSARSPSWKKTF